MSEPIGDNGNGHALAQQLARVGVPESVETDPLQAALLRQFCDTHAHLIRFVIGAFRPAEDEPVVFVIAPVKPLVLILLGAVLNQSIQRLPWDQELTGLAALRGLDA
jgi:hypothetical protein